MSNSRDKIYKGIYDDVNESIKTISNTFQGATNSFTRVMGDTTQTVLSLLNPTDSKKEYLPKEIKKPTTKTEDTKENEKKYRKTRTYSANATASISLEGAKFKTLAQPSFFEATYHYISGKKTAKYVDDNIDICHDMAQLEKDIQAEIDKNEQADKDAIQLLQLRKVNLVKDQIVEHAARRADMFFYLCVSVHGTNVQIEKINRAKEQYGSGSTERGTAACHSSLFPNIKIEYCGKPSTLFDDSYFVAESNSTVELPKIVNDFDGHLEGRFQPTTFVDDCVKILNDISKKKIDPIQGMNQFYQVMNEHFIYFSRKHLKKKTKIANHLAHEKVWEYQREGTFFGADEKTLEVTKTYLNTMLRINSYSNMLPYSSYIAQIQKEILTAKSNDVRPERANPNL